MNRLYIIFSIVIACYNLNAQNEVPNQPFIKLKTGDIITGSKLDLEENMLKADYIILDDVKYKMHTIKFYGYDKNKIYGRFNSLLESYQNNNGIYYYKKYIPPSYNHYTKTSTYGGFTYHYSIGLNDVKGISLSNLLTDKKYFNDEKFIGQLNQAKKYRTRSRLLFVTAVGCFVTVPFVMEYVFPRLGMIPLGTGLFLTYKSFKNYKKKWKTVEKAMIDYAGFYY